MFEFVMGIRGIGFVIKKQDTKMGRLGQNENKIIDT
jgi:hypothetical protein